MQAHPSRPGTDTAAAIEDEDRPQGMITDRKPPEHDSGLIRCQSDEDGDED
jgi:hypothetical protein